MKITIPRPCHENWDSMAASEKENSAPFAPKQFMIFQIFQMKS